MKQTGLPVKRYDKGPEPFVAPAVWPKLVSGGRPGYGPYDLIPRETLHYSAEALEEIMIAINAEYSSRLMTAPTWKRYKSSTSDYTRFTPKSDGRTLSTVSVAWFPQYVQDIQDAIDALLEDTSIPDSRANYLARIFCNNTIASIGTYKSGMQLKDGISTPAGVINPLTDAQNGEWPFTREDLINAIPFKGVGFDKNQRINVNTGVGSIETRTGDFPVSEIGTTDADGNIGGIDVPMTASNRPTRGSRTQLADTSLGVGEGQPEYDQGYAYLSHVALAVQQLRWQPPQVEFWPNDVAVRDYVSNQYSNTTPALSWFLGQPTETIFGENWGYWLIKGRSGVQNGQALLRIYENPTAAAGSAGQCPFSLWYPPLVINCSCGWTENASFIWYTPGFRWDGVNWPQTSRGTQKQFGPNTHLKTNITSSQADAGANVTSKRFSIRVRTARIGDVNNQIFVPIIDVEVPHNGEISVNIQQKLHEYYGAQYPIGETDAILAMQILLQAYTSAGWTVDAEFAPGGLRVPAGASTQQLCTIPDITVAVDYVSLDEVEIVGDPVSSYR